MTPIDVDTLIRNTACFVKSLAVANPDSVSFRIGNQYITGRKMYWCRILYLIHRQLVRILLLSIPPFQD